ncbi:MAG: tetratricopeptide repeat protein [Gemmatimonadaceae bacterium]|nr:tetratricopeptide repeat protein [Gemmatimonadaceae bacterium]
MHPVVARCLSLGDGKSDPASATRVLAACSQAAKSEAIPALQRATALVFKARALKTLGQAPASMDAIREAVRMEPASAPILAEYGIALSEAGQLDAAEQQFRAALALDGEEAFALSGLGHVLAKQRRYGEASKYLERALRYPRIDPDTRGLLALVLVFNGEIARATELAMRAVREAPNRPLLQKYAALVLSEQGTHVEALPYARRAVQLAPRDPGVFITLGYTAHYTAQFVESVRAFEHALRLDPAILNADDSTVYAGSKAGRRVGK